jgi:hypothetical protein
MHTLSSSVESFSPGQKVQTDFGPGVVSAISHIDSIIYVTLSGEPTGLYLFRPEQVEPIDHPAGEAYQEAYMPPA